MWKDFSLPNRELDCHNAGAEPSNPSRTDSLEKGEASGKPFKSAGQIIRSALNRTARMRIAANFVLPARTTSRTAIAIEVMA
jgi:hypothetical protein